MNKSVSLLTKIEKPLPLVNASPELVKAVQECLGVVIDGIPGPKTIAAFKAFKQQHHLGEPDLLGPTTAQKLLEKRLPISKSDHIELIKTECRSQGFTDPRAIAYILATVQHETAGTFQPIDEYGGRHTRYSPYWGRGYVQLTWKSNYQKYSEILGQDFVNHPELVKVPSTAAFILVHGFKTGAFTGKKLSDYINSQNCDFHNCRRCINGTDRAELIAKYAQEWLKRLV